MFFKSYFYCVNSKKLVYISIQVQQMPYTTKKEKEKERREGKEEGRKKEMKEGRKEEKERKGRGGKERKEKREGRGGVGRGNLIRFPFR